MDLVFSFLKMIADSSGFIVGGSPDGGLSLVMSGLAGVAAALAVALILAVYFRTGYRSARDILRHGLAATAVLGLLAFVAHDVGHAALAYLGINPSKPEAGFELPLPRAASALAELHTDQRRVAGFGRW
jgi:high-affinity Fe2+/Pb2+ permease